MKLKMEINKFEETKTKTKTVTFGMDIYAERLGETPTQLPEQRR